MIGWTVPGRSAARPSSAAQSSRGTTGNTRASTSAGSSRPCGGQSVSGTGRRTPAREDRWVSAPRRPCAATATAPSARGIGERLRFYRDAAEHACPGRQRKPVPLDQSVPAGDLQFACLRAGAFVGALRGRRHGAFASGAIAEGLPVSGVLLAGTTFDVGHSAAARGTEPVTLTELDLHRLTTDSAGFHDLMLLGNAATSRAVTGHDAERAGDLEFGAASLALDGVERLP